MKIYGKDVKSVGHEWENVSKQGKVLKRESKIFTRKVSENKMFEFSFS